MSEGYSGTPSAASYYERLGVDPDASDDAVATAGKRAKRAVHPDSNSSEQATAEREFDRVTDASDALTDSDSRAAYDTFINEQGPETGTDQYEQWDADGRARPPTEWLSQPRASGSSGSVSTTSTSSTTTTSASTTRSQSTAGTETASTTRQPHGTTADASTARETVDDDDGQQTAASPSDSEFRGTNTASKRAPESVLGEDPEELYSKYVLDSEAEWGSPEAAEAAGGGSDGDTARVTARYVPRGVDRVVGAVVDSPLGAMFTVAAPQSRLGRLAAVAVWVALAVALGPVGELLAFAPFVVMPRIGPWLYPPLAAGAVLAPSVVPLETQPVVFAGFAVLAVGYYVLVGGSQLDPYAT